MSQKHILLVDDDSDIREVATLSLEIESSRPGLEARVTRLEAAVSVVVTGDLGEGMRAEAERDAHILAGTLGSCGRRRASLLVRELEELFASEDPPAHVDGPHLRGVVGALRDEVHARPT